MTHPRPPQHHRRPLCAALAVLAALALSSTAVAAPRRPVRTIAVTFDDLPLVPTTLSDDAQEVLTRRLLRALRQSHTPATGFVNEDKLCIDGDYDQPVDPRRVALLDAWLDAGMDLGNHTFDHLDLHKVGETAFEDAILRGETVTRERMAERGREPRFFRHPYLDTGKDLDEKERVATFLGEHGYSVAPVTIDNSDWVFAPVYHAALAAGDLTLAARVAAAYLDSMTEKLVYWEAQSQTAFGRLPAQILLLHANELNANHYRELVARIRARGYRLIPLEQALRDPIYRRPDVFTGDAGPGWIQRWVLAAGRQPLPGEPSPPDWVSRLADAIGDD